MQIYTKSCVFSRHFCIFAKSLTMEGKILIIPDVHCRSFWKEPLKHLDGYTKVVFLGDYLDPYKSEGTTFEEGFANLEEIIRIKKENPDKVVLFLGNHDLGYLDNNICTARHAWNWENDVRTILKENFELFDLAWETTIGELRYFFSHAGVTKGWLEDHENIFHFRDGDALPKAELFNNMFHGDDKQQKSMLYSALADIGTARWGTSDNGSIIWADEVEHHHWENNPNFFDGVYQIFAHSQQEEYPVIDTHYACLDCRKAFVLDETGTILDYETGEKAKVMSEEEKEKKEEEERKSIEFLSAFFL